MYSRRRKVAHNLAPAPAVHAGLLQRFVRAGSVARRGLQLRLLHCVGVGGGGGVVVGGGGGGVVGGGVGGDGGFGGDGGVGGVGGGYRCHVGSFGRTSWGPAEKVDTKKYDKTQRAAGQKCQPDPN
ncbi:hypothetical protein HC256_002464 [Beauveria bassiana]|nr:hypothetical protein HC256_002464 [Beauveria bassiana]